MRAAVKAGAPPNPDGTLHFVRFAAWLFERWRWPPAATSGNAQSGEGGSAFKTRDDVARYFGVSVRTVATWMSEGMPGEAGTPGQRDGSFDLEKIEAWLAARGGVKQNEPTPERRRQDSARADLLDLKVAEARGELLPAAETMRHLTRTIHDAKGLLNQLPTRLGRLLPEKTPEAVRARHRQRVQRTLDAAYQALEEIFTTAAANAESGEGGQ